MSETNGKMTQPVIRKGAGPIIADDEVLYSAERLFDPNELANLRIDYSYQRNKVYNKIGELVTVMRGGGIIPDPITVAERQDGSKWIVDGQQRYWAALEAERPLLVRIYIVTDHEAELKLFTALNNSAALTAGVIIGAWTGPARDCLQLLDTSPDSSFRGRVSWKGTKSPNAFGAGIILRGLLSLLSGNLRAGGGGVKEVLRSFDAYAARNQRWTKRACLSWAEIVGYLFPVGLAGEFRVPIASALGRTCHLRWDRLYEGPKEEWPLPAKTQMDKIRLLDWRHLAPTSGGLYTTACQDAVEGIWPLPSSIRKRLGAP